MDLLLILLIPPPKILYKLGLSLYFHYSCSWSSLIGLMVVAGVLAQGRACGDVELTTPPPVTRFSRRMPQFTGGKRFFRETAHIILMIETKYNCTYMWKLPERQAEKGMNRVALTFGATRERRLGREFVQAG
jgi:hypothetical protein